MLDKVRTEGGTEPMGLWEEKKNILEKLHEKVLAWRFGLEDFPVFSFCFYYMFVHELFSNYYFLRFSELDLLH